MFIYIVFICNKIFLKNKNVNESIFDEMRTLDTDGEFSIIITTLFFFVIHETKEKLFDEVLLFGLPTPVNTRRLALVFIIRELKNLPLFLIPTESFFP